MHKFSTVVPKLPALTALRSLRLLDVPYSTPCGAFSRAPGQDGIFDASLYENLCIIRASGCPKDSLFQVAQEGVFLEERQKARKFKIDRASFYKCRLEAPVGHETIRFDGAVSLKKRHSVNASRVKHPCCLT